MAEPVISTLMIDVRDRIRAALPDMQNRITYGAPEGKPVAPSVWLDVMVPSYEMGLLDVLTVQAIATVAVPRKSAYPKEYEATNDLMQQVWQAVRGQVTYATDATLVGIAIEPVTGSGYAGEPDVLVAGRVIATLEVKTQIQAVP